MEKLTCCFIGHRKVNETEELRKRIKEIVEKLITEDKTEIFLFGSKSRFDRLCYEEVTRQKEKHPHIKRIYVRAEYRIIDEDYKNCLLERYEDTYFPERIAGAGKAVYVERNFEMINKSDICVIHYNEQTAPAARKSGAGTAFDYAIRRKKRIIRVL